MAKLTEEELQTMELQSTEELVQMVIRNERKRRRVEDDKKAYSAACNDLVNVVEAQTEAALEILEKRDIEAGTLKAPGHKPIVEFPSEEQRKERKAKKEKATRKKAEAKKKAS